MRALRSLLLIFLSCLSCLPTIQAFEQHNSQSQGHSSDRKQREEKISQVDQIIVINEGVLLLIGDFWLKTQSIQIVPEGFWVLEDGEWMMLEEAINCRQSYVFWKCQNCDTLNPIEEKFCERCGEPLH